jgi:uncharacterized membrane protein YeaQ/YmgE (transglycosylase-associated protein family)
MGAFDLLSWVAGGLIAGSLIDSISPAGARGARLVTVPAACVGAVAAGSAVAALTAISTVAFLGAVCAAVLSAASLAYLLRRSGAGRYHG